MYATAESVRRIIRYSWTGAIIFNDVRFRGAFRYRVHSVFSDVVRCLRRSATERSTYCRSLFPITEPYDSPKIRSPTAAGHPGTR